MPNCAAAVQPLLLADQHRIVDRCMAQVLLHGRADIHGDAHDLEPLAAIALAELAQQRDLAPARRAPRGPEINDERTAAERAQRAGRSREIGQRQIRYRARHRPRRRRRRSGAAGLGIAARYGDARGGGRRVELTRDWRRVPLGLQSIGRNPAASPAPTTRATATARCSDFKREGASSLPAPGAAEPQNSPPSCSRRHENAAARGLRDRRRRWSVVRKSETHAAAPGPRNCWP